MQVLPEWKFSWCSSNDPSGLKLICHSYAQEVAWFTCQRWPSDTMGIIKWKQKIMRKEARWLSVSTISHLSELNDKWIIHNSFLWEGAYPLWLLLYGSHSSYQMAFTEQGEIWTSKCKVLYTHLPAPQTPGHIASLYSTNTRESLSQIDSPQAFLQHLRKGCFRIWLQQRQDQLRQK